MSLGSLTEKDLKGAIDEAAAEAAAACAAMSQGNYQDEDEVAVVIVGLVLDALIQWACYGGQPYPWL